MTNLLRGVGSNGTLQENSSFNLDEVPIPINLNFTQSIDNCSLDRDNKNTPAATKNEMSIEANPGFETKQKKDNKVQIINNQSLHET